MADPTRTVVLVRHAKADRPPVNDHERPLAARGHRDAPRAGRWLAGSGVTPDLALCSTAARCRETWKLVVAELPHRPRTVYEDRLYGASAGELIDVVNETADDVGTLLLVGHNPGLHDLADTLAGEAEGDLLARMARSGLPTSAIAVLTFTGSWEDVEPGSTRLAAYWAPHA
ncbi:SixA phosphatase family protein [Nocardiopsis lucentensis]|uniref:SixA phosphatase family protein n=1 Tax=Nocardiopsis lucentensis TaxID=53441 RepID=UPI000345905C|nr:histidine phosphatase family protein [Nocardiopsis lucentensis]